MTPLADAPDESRSRRVVAGMRVLLLAPLALAALAWLALPNFRATLNEGVRLLASGDLEGLRAWGGELGPWAAAFTTLLMVVQALAAPIPAVLVTWTNSWLFGWFAGGWLSIAAATLAALVCFALARAFGATLAARMLAPAALEKSERFVLRHGAAAVLVSRLLPFVPFDPISYVAGLTGMRAWTFAWTTFVGQIPAGLAYSYLGQAIARPARFVLLAALILLALCVLGWSVSRALRARASA